LVAGLHVAHLVLEAFEVCQPAPLVQRPAAAQHLHDALSSDAALQDERPGDDRLAADLEELADLAPPLEHFLVLRTLHPPHGGVAAGSRAGACSAAGAPGVVRARRPRWRSVTCSCAQPRAVFSSGATARRSPACGTSESPRISTGMDGPAWRICLPVSSNIDR